MNGIKQVQASIRRLSLRYSIAIGMILVLIITGGTFVQISQSQLKNDAHLINVAGQQRLFALRFSKDALALQFVTAPTLHNYYIRELSSTLNQWQTIHHELTTANVNDGFAEAQSPASSILYSQLEPHFQALLSATQVAVISTAIVASENVIPFQTIINESTLFLAGMDKIVKNYEIEANARTVQVNHYELFILASIILILTMTTLVVFRPAMMHINRSVTELDSYIIKESEQMLQSQQLNEAMEEMLEEISLQSEELQQQRNFMDVLFDHISPDVLLVIGDTGTIIRCNNALLDLFGYEREHIIDHTAEIFFENEEAYQVMISNLMSHDISSITSTNCETLWYTNKGKSIDMELSLCWVSAIQSIIIIGRNITQRREMDILLQHTLAESQQRSNDLTTVFDTVQDGLLVYNLQFQELRRNKMAGLMLGSPSSDAKVLTHTADRFVVTTLDGSPVPYDEYPITRVLKGEENPPSKLMSVRRRANNVRLIISANAAPLRDSLDNIIGGMAYIRDVTETYHQEKRLHILREVTKACSIAAEQTTVAQTALEVLVQQLGIARGAIILLDERRPGYVRLVADAATEVELFNEGQEEILQSLLEETPISADSHIPAIRTLATGEPVFDATIESDTFRGHLYSTDLPLRFSGKIIGVLGFVYTEEQLNVFGVPDHDLLLTVADEIAAALERAHLYEDVKRLALEDALTGLANHRALQQIIQYEATQTDRFNGTMGLIMLDVDHFRRFNEKYGHAVGDLALHTVAQAIQKSVRDCDTAARYGGEEFSVILPQTAIAETMIVAERIRQAIASSFIPVEGQDEPVPVTASLGCAIYPADATTTENLFKAADLALYESKHNGRNQVHAYTENMFAAQNNTENMLTSQNNTENALISQNYAENLTNIGEEPLQNAA